MILSTHTQSTMSCTSEAADKQFTNSLLCVYSHVLMARISKTIVFIVDLSSALMHMTSKINTTQPLIPK